MNLRIFRHLDGLSPSKKSGQTRQYSRSLKPPLWSGVKSRSRRQRKLRYIYQAASRILGYTDLYTYLRPQPALYSEAQPGNLRPGANARAVGFAWWRGVVPKPRWPAARAADRPSRQGTLGAGEVQSPLGGDVVTTGWSRTGRPGASQENAEPQATGRHGSPLTPAAPGDRRTAALRKYPRAAAGDTPADTRNVCPPAPRDGR